MEHLSNDHNDCSNQHKNRHKLCSETWHLIVNWIESQWKMRQQRDGKATGGKAVVEQILASEK